MQGFIWEGGGIQPPAIIPLWNLFANMHTMTTLYVAPSKCFKVSNSRFTPPFDEFLNETL